MSEISWFDVYTAACREVAILPDGWVVQAARALGHPTECKGLMVTGAVCPPKTRGPDKGAPNWAKRDRATQANIRLSIDACNAAYDRMRADAAILNEQMEARS